MLANTDPDENNGPYYIGAALLFLLLVWKVLWPIMKANNIMQKPVTHYGKSEGTGKYKLMSPVAGVILAIALNLMEVGVFTYHWVFKIPIVPLRYHHRYQYYPGKYFYVSLVDVIALFIYTYIDNSAFDKIRDFKYLVKTWLTTVILSPAIFLLCCPDKVAGADSEIYLYINLVIKAHGAGVFVFGTLLFTTTYFSKKPWPTAKKRWLIFWPTQVMLLTTSIILGLCLHYTIQAILAWVILALIIGLGIKYYPMNPTIYSDETAQASESADN